MDLAEAAVELILFKRHGSHAYTQVRTLTGVASFISTMFDTIYGHAVVANGGGSHNRVTRSRTAWNNSRGTATSAI